jgi:hypothetical protein
MPRALHTDAWTLMDCPKCKSAAGSECRTPKGKKAYPPHRERCDATVEKYGWEPYTIPARPPPFWLQKK